MRPQPFPLNKRQPRAKKLTPKAAMIVSGTVVVTYKKAKKGPDGKPVLDANGKPVYETVREERDAKGRILLEQSTFKNYAGELLQRRAWDNYVEGLAKKFNNVNKPKDKDK